MVGAASIALVAIIAGATAATLGLIRATEAERIAVQEAERATAAEQEAVENLAIANQTTEFMIDLFDVSNPYVHSTLADRPGTDITAKEILDGGAERIRSELADDPQRQSHIMTEIGRVYLGLGLPADAKPLLDDALAIRRTLFPPGHFTIGNSMLWFGLYHMEVGDYASSVSAYREGIEIHESYWGTDAVGLVWMLNSYSVALANTGQIDESINVQERALDILSRQQDPNVDDLGEALNNLGYIQNSMSRFQEAAESFQQAIDVYADSEYRGMYSRALSNLASVRLALGQYAESYDLQQQALEVKRDWFPADHIEIAYSLANLSFIYHHYGNFENSAELKREAINIFSTQFGAGHPNIGVILGGLGWDLSMQGRYAEAEETLRDALDLLRRALGEDNLREPPILNTLAEMYAAQGEFARAESHFRDALRIYSATGVAHAEEGRALGGIANLSESSLAETERVEYFEDGIEKFRSTAGLSSPEGADLQLNFGEFLVEQGEPERAREMFDAGFTFLAAALPHDSPQFLKQAKRYERLFGEPPP